MIVGDPDPGPPVVLVIVTDVAAKMLAASSVVAL